MYITVNLVRGEKTIYLPYSIRNMDGSKEIALFEIFADTVTYQITTPLTLKLSDDGKAEKLIPKRKYTARELNAFLAGAFLEGDVELKSLGKYPQIIKTNTLAKITKMNLHLSELDNTQNLEDGKLSDILLTVPIAKYSGFTHTEPKNPHYKKLKNGVFQSLTLRLTDQHGGILKEDLGTTVVLHIR